ncbi:peptidoglycan-binding domain-containing protein [Paenibacillus mendelii]|uniref:Peptidoglycan-binding domain-containing protein n=1 Tax=Paenibacillus mendelii TaxID=206163 RepID=A0ABV6J9T1_9BACL|nr:peptidoglycan-binding domain-containing protein [Paenibacillus mendelii]MCQ6563986.1 peptidoglycan-binding protein [Paenibacillus mendelii]
MEKCASEVKGLQEIMSIFGGTVVETAIEIHYCATKGGCIPFPGLSGSGLLPTDYFDVRQGFHICATLAAFLKLHNPAVDEVLIATQCSMPNPTPADKFAVPDIITHEPGRTEFYEIKPVRGAAEGRRKLLKFRIFCSMNAISHYVPGIQYTPNEDRPITTQLWLGTPAKFRFRFVRTEAGLILWDICVETSVDIVVEAVWKTMLTRLMIALLFLAPELVLIFAQTNLQSEAGTLAALGNTVGVGGTNDHADVQAVQIMLNDWRTNNGRNAIGMDGLAGSETIDAITDFQQSVTGAADGRIDPGGPAIIALERAHLQSIVSPDPTLEVEPYMLEAFYQLTLDSFESLIDPENNADNPLLARVENMLRVYFQELRRG